MDKQKNVMCCVDGCNKEMYRYENGNPYCCRHRGQIRRLGHILENTRYNTNAIHIQGEVAFIDLYNKQREVISQAIIDVKDVDLVSSYKWTKATNGYVMAKIGDRIVYLHRFIMQNIKDICVKEVDHINRNPLDNRRVNLRLTTPSENLLNKSNYSNSKSGHKNIHFSKDRNKWVFSISYEGNRHSKRFNTIEEAIVYRNNYYSKHNIFCYDFKNRK